MGADGERVVAIDVRDVPAKIVRAVERDAARSGASVNDTVVRALSEAVNEPVVPSGYPTTSRSGSDHWNVRMPERLRSAVRREAKLDGSTLTAFVLRTLAARYGLTPPPRTPRRAAPRFDTRTTNQIRRRHADGESIRSLARRYGAKRETIARVLRAEG